MSVVCPTDRLAVTDCVDYSVLITTTTLNLLGILLAPCQRIGALATMLSRTEPKTYLELLKDSYSIHNHNK